MVFNLQLYAAGIGEFSMPQTPTENNCVEIDAISDLILKKVNALGELHLDREFTSLLIRWLKSVERTLESQADLVKKLQGLTKNWDV